MYPEHINLRDGSLVTPLVAALDGRFSQVAELLHQHQHDAGIDVWALRKAGLCR
jgi:hypothetical protein